MKPEPARQTQLTESDGYSQRCLDPLCDNPLESKRYCSDECQ
jgi:hypothetical protein